jgi:hypothetical protein
LDRSTGQVRRVSLYAYLEFKPEEQSACLIGFVGIFEFVFLFFVVFVLEVGWRYGYEGLFCISYLNYLSFGFKVDVI